MMIKPIGANGQVTLCTKYAGQYVAIEEMELGVWILKLGDFIPRSERWLHEPAFAAELDEALEWASTHAREEMNPDELERRLQDDDNRSSGSQ